MPSPTVDYILGDALMHSHVAGDINGLDTTYGRKKAVVTKTSTYTATTLDEVIICNKTTAMTINLPAATGSGQTYSVKSINTGAITVDANSSETIDGALTQVIYQWESITVVDYVTGAWIII